MRSAPSEVAGGAGATLGCVAGGPRVTSCVFDVMVGLTHFTTGVSDEAMPLGGTSQRIGRHSKGTAKRPNGADSMRIRHCHVIRSRQSLQDGNPVGRGVLPVPDSGSVLVPATARPEDRYYSTTKLKILTERWCLRSQALAEGESYVGGAVTTPRQEANILRTSG